MAAVLGVDQMNVNTYKSILYKDVFENTDLIVSIVEGEIKFRLVGPIQKALDFKLYGYDLHYSQEKSNQFTISDKLAQIATIESDNTEINEDVISVYPSRDSEGFASFNLIIR